MPEYNGKKYILLNVEKYTCKDCAFEYESCNDQRLNMGDCGSNKIYVELENEPNTNWCTSFAPDIVTTPIPTGRRVNALGGVKNDGGKLQPTLLLKSMPRAVKQVIEVLQHGADKYGADNWKLVENNRYDDAMLRHLVFGYLAGEKVDPDSGKQHLAHIICCALFLLDNELSANE